MIDPEPLPLKNTALWLILIVFGIITGYLVFIGIASLWVGFRHLDQDGFWMPILAGTLLICFLFWTFFRVARMILIRIREKETLNVQA